MLNLHVPPRLARAGRFFTESDHGAWAVIAVGIVTFALIVAAFMWR
jgi:hypothetical protein